MNKILAKIFATDEINTGRQIFLDIAKTFAVFHMVFVHVFEDWNMDFAKYPEVLKGHIIASALVISAPLFMFCMGVGLMYSKNTNIKYNIIRGVNLFKLGILLNIFRSVIPIIILMLAFWLDLWDTFFEELTTDDILHFAGLSLIFIGVLKWLKFSTFNICAVGIIFSILGNVYQNIHFDNYWINVLFGLFIHTEDENYLSAFPLIHWFIFVVFGMLFGQFLRRCKNPKKLIYSLCFPAGLIYFSYTIYAWQEEIGMYEKISNYYSMGIFEALYALCGVFVGLGIFMFFAEIFSDKLKASCVEISKNITLIYIIHFVIIDVLSAVNDAILDWEITLIPAIISGIVIFILSVKLARFYKIEIAKG